MPAAVRSAPSAGRTSTSTRAARRSGCATASARTAAAARAAWRYDTAVTRDLAERARHAAAIRGIDLDNPAEQVTAEEWLDVHRAEQLSEDEHREITEHDIDDELREEFETVAGEQEPADAEPRRTVPPDQVQVDVDRASVALAAADHRRGEEVGRAAGDDRSADEHLSRLAQWASDDAAMRAEPGADARSQEDLRTRG